MILISQGIVAGLLSVHKVLVTTVVGEDEIMETNIINIMKGVKVLSQDTRRKVLSFFRSDRSKLCTVGSTVRSQGRAFLYYPVHLAVIFNRTEVLDLVYELMREDKHFASKVLHLRVGGADKLEDSSSSVTDKERSL